MSTAAIAIMARRKKLIRIFRDAGATNIDSAIDTARYGIRQSLIFNKLVRDGILVNTSSNSFYLDESTEAEWSRQRHKIMLMVLAVLLIFALLTYFVDNFK